MNDNRIYGLLAEFKGPKELLNAAKSVRDEGFIDFDCHTPFPVHGLDDAMGLKRSIVGYIVGIGCFLGASGGLLLQWWSSTIEYPVVISGKPFFSWQAYMIITFVFVGAGQFLLNLGDPAKVDLFILVSILLSFALLPILLSSTEQPNTESPKFFSLLIQYLIFG